MQHWVMWSFFFKEEGKHAMNYIVFLQNRPFAHQKPIGKFLKYHEDWYATKFIWVLFEKISIVFLRNRPFAHQKPIGKFLKYHEDWYATKFIWVLFEKISIWIDAKIRLLSVLWCNIVWPRSNSWEIFIMFYLLPRFLGTIWCHLCLQIWVP